MAINETASDVVLNVVPWDHPHAEQLRAAQRADIVARYGGNFEPGHRPTAADIAVFVVAYDGATPIGCGAFRDLVDEQPTVEVKRMYVRPEYRGRKIGQLILRDLEARARERGAMRVRLETGTRQPEAVRLYEGAGYRQIPNFGDYVDAPTSLCYERILDATR
ncbi:MAG TPA: GNAT family N-acetyltransferase [Acidothermaceae bacterium]